MRLAPLLGLALSAPAFAAQLSPEAELARILNGATPGKPQTCLPAFDRSEGKNVPQIGIVYGWGRTLYLNRFQDGCHLDRDDVVVTSTPTGELCRGDIAHIVGSTSHIEHDSCVFGDFVPYTKAKGR